METWSVHQLFERSSGLLGSEVANRLRLYADRLIHTNVPVIFTLRHLSKIVGCEFSFLRETVGRHRESSNYKMFAVRKRSGQARYIHAVSQNLLSVQKFLNTEVLQHVSPHSASFAFHHSGGIRSCAARHCGAKWLFKFDLNDFFFSINEADVFDVFVNLGYRPLLSFELARICTTTRLPPGAYSHTRPRGNEQQNRPYWRKSLRLGVLPQGAPTSPMLSNLIARPLDVALHGLAVQYGFVYTRYADDLAFSISKMPTGISAGKFRQLVIAKIVAAGYSNNESKARVLGPGARKTVLGLLVDGQQPRISRQTYARVDGLLYAIHKFGLASTVTHFGFDSEYGLHNHVGGLVAYVLDVDPARGAEFRERYRAIATSWG